MYQSYIDNPDLARKRLQILCANCNWIKKAERNEAPIKEIIQKLQSHVNALQNSYAATADAKGKVLPILASRAICCQMQKMNAMLVRNVPSLWISLVL